MDRVWCFVRGSQKAIVGAATAGVLYLATRYKVDLPIGWEVTVTSAATALLIYFVPNKHCE